MRDEQLSLLIKAHRGSSKALRGRAITPPEEAALHAVVRMIEPVLSPVEKSRTRSMLREISEISQPPTARWTSATPASCRLAGRFFRLLG
jgi:hypothetical protein